MHCQEIQLLVGEQKQQERSMSLDAAEVRPEGYNSQSRMGMFSGHFPFPSLDLGSCCFSLSYR